MRGVVVRDQMQLKVGRRVAINLLEEAQPFDVDLPQKSGELF